MAETVLSKTQTFAQLPPVWPESTLAEIRAMHLRSGRRLVVLDDDPTGTQTVHDVPLLTDWPVELLAEEMRRSDTFFVLTNSRSLTEADAVARTMEIGQNLKAAAGQTGLSFFVLSRSDSTLRGHYPAEVDALSQAVGRVYDATIMAPFFEAGGRFTYENTHYVQQGDLLVPAALTEFAKDKAFPYSHSYLPLYVDEKTAGRIKSNQVFGISIQTIREGGPQAVFQQLMKIPNGSVIVLNACDTRDMEVAVTGMYLAQDAGKTYIYRSAADLVRVLAGIEMIPLLSAQSMAIETVAGGVMFVGSHIQKSSEQLERALALPGVESLEIKVKDLLDNSRRTALVLQYTQTINETLRAGKNMVAYTSRELIAADSAAGSLSISRIVSHSICRMVQGLTVQPRFIIAKGGITSNDIATIGLNVKRAMVAGQLQPGVPVWKLGAESRFPGMHYVVYPGNVGSANGLAQAISAFS